MTRWHLLRRGRIVSSADVPEGAEPEPWFPRARPADLLVSDGDWRAVHWRRALLAKSVQA